MDIHTYPLGPFATNCYWVAGANPIIVDAPKGAFNALSPFLQKQPPTYLFITHSHWDHTADASLFKKAFPKMKIVIGKEDIENLQHPGSDGLPCFISIEGVEGDYFPIEGDMIDGFRVMETPGHTPGGLSFFHSKDKILFSGDTLFKGTFGNLSFPTARPALMWQSLKKLATLPTETIVYPGHGEPTTIGNEPWLSHGEGFS